MNWRFILTIFIFQWFIWMIDSQGKNKKSFDNQLRKRKTKLHSYFAICAIVKDEPDLREWVDYHYRMGCGRFYLTDNGAKLSVASQLQDYIDSNIVVVNQTSEMAQQLPSYQKCLNKYRSLHQWMAFIDADEFIVSSRYCSIPGILRYYADYGGLGLQRVLYGSSGHLTKPSGGVIANYHNCKATPHLKSIVNLDYGLTHVGNPHFFYYSSGKYTVTTDFERVDKPSNKPAPHLFEILYINHYHLKSKEEFLINRQKGRADHLDYNISDSFKDESYFQRYDLLSKNNCSLLRMPATRVKSCSKLAIFTTRNASSYLFYRNSSTMKMMKNMNTKQISSLTTDQKVQLLAEMLKKEKNITLSNKNLIDIRQMIEQQLEKKKKLLLNTKKFKNKNY